MREYTAWIGDSDRQPQRWIYCVDAQQVIDGDVVALRAKTTGDSLPADQLPEGNERLIGRVGLSSLAEVEDAARAAAGAYQEWSRRSARCRCELMSAVREVLDAKRDEYFDILVSEGHPAGLVQIEIEALLASFSEPSIHEMWRRLEDQRQTGEHSIVYLRRPDGVVGVNPPANAAATNSLFGVGALVSGNAVVVRVPTSVPLGTAWVWHEVVRPALHAVDAPPGIANVICHSAAPVLDSWRNSDHIDTLAYFGSSSCGTQLGAQWYARGKKAVLELAGNDGMLIWRDCDIDRATDALTECFHGSAQICLVPKYAIVHPAIADVVLEKLVARASALIPRPLSDRDAVLSPVLNQQGFFELLSEALDGGMTALCGGYRLDGTGQRTTAGLFVAPTILRVNGFDRAANTRAVTEETFFPLLPVIVPDVSDSDDDLLAASIAFMNHNAFGLRNSIHASDESVIRYALSALTNGGIVKVNDSHITTAPGAPSWGGTGYSGGPYGEANIPALSTTHLQAVIRRRTA